MLFFLLAKLACVGVGAQGAGLGFLAFPVLSVVCILNDDTQKEVSRAGVGRCCLTFFASCVVIHWLSACFYLYHRVRE